MISRTIKNFAAVAVVFLGSIASAQAAIINVSTSDGIVSPDRDNQGFWLEGAANSNHTNDNYFTREVFTHRSYFSFALSSVTGTVIGASLWQTTASGAALELYDVNTSATDLAQRAHNR
jgi:opacity protein-like surface antigen